MIIYFGDFSTLRADKMISTIQLMTYVRMTCIFMISYAMLAFINIKMTFLRISELLNIENYEMR